MSDLAQAVPWVRDEAELVTELQARSDAAFDWLVNSYHAPVYNLVFGILGDGADAADVTQEVFLKVFRGIRGFRRGSSLKTWLYRIAVREALNHRRWCWRHLRQLISLDAQPPEGRPALDLPDLERTPFESFAAGEVQEVIRRGLAAVPERFRGAVILRDLEGLTYEEIAEILDVSVGTVKSRILRGRRALREVLDPLVGAVAQLVGHDAAESRRPAFRSIPQAPAFVRPAFAPTRSRGGAR
jgi:RNA polymerase sigma-70 factor (ECF subfamily)